MKYVTCKHYERPGLFMPAGVECEEVNGVIMYLGVPVCSAKSRVAHQYFAANDDGNGMERWKLAMAIEAAIIEKAHEDNVKMSETEADAEEDEPNVIMPIRFKAPIKQESALQELADDDLCASYRREDVQDVWMWNQAFYNAPIEDLESIASLIGAKIGGD